MTINLNDWLLEVGTGTDTQTGVPQGPPLDQPTMGGPPPQQGGDPNIANIGGQDVADDPQVPDMPEDIGEEDKDFGAWRKEFLAESVKGDVQILKDLISQVRDRDLDPYQHKFVEDNLQILQLREHANVDKASKEMRKLLSQEIDHNNPGTTIVNHLQEVLAEQPMLTSVFIKMTGLLGLKGELHRKFIAGLLGAVQVGASGYNEDLIYNEKDYSIKISTRFASRFGEFRLGTWALRQDDPERYLKAPELKRLEDGSPEEKDVLRRRIVMESIAEAYNTRAFLLNVVGTDGTIYTVGWDIATSLRSAYAEGKLVVRTKQDDTSEAVIDEDGNIIPLVDLKIMYSQQTGEVDEEGKPARKEVEFLHKKDGQLLLTAQLPTLREAATYFQGMAFKETPWQGNPTDLKTLSRCVPTLLEFLMRQC